MPKLDGGLEDESKKFAEVLAIVDRVISNDETALPPHWQEKYKRKYVLFVTLTVTIMTLRRLITFLTRNLSRWQIGKRKLSTIPTIPTVRFNSRIWGVGLGRRHVV
jgi:hypothetical protein